ncbi:MAG: phosphodiester glycosidase family protein [Polyangiaceae bacterium]
MMVQRAVIVGGVWLGVAAVGCGPAAPPLEAKGGVPTASAKAPPVASVASVSAGPVETGVVAEAAPPPPPPPPVPPPDAEVPFERTKAEGDGKWSVYIGAGEGEPGLMYKTTVHPHPVNGFVYAAVVAIDLTRTEVRLVAGTDEPESKTFPKERRTGLVPKERVDDVLVVMNGGFMAKHGKYSMMLEGEEMFEPREDACAVARRKDGSMWIAPWIEMKGKNAELEYYRQTPHCLIDKGVMHPDLDSEYKRRHWGGQDNGRKDTRRSAVGLSADGKILFYALGEWVFPKDIALVMKSVGAVSAAQLDINWSYTRFLRMGRPSPGDAVQVVSTLVPKIEHSKKGYVEKAATRDFFYVVPKKKAEAAP